MNIKQMNKSLRQAELDAQQAEDPRPREIETKSEAEFMAVIEKSSLGQLVIASISRGKTNGAWVFSVRDPQPYTLEFSTP